MTGWAALVCSVAAKKLTDQSLLAKCATADSSLIVREAAICKLEDQALLGWIAATDASHAARRAAFEALTDPALLADFLVADRGLFTDVLDATRAVDRLRDPAAIARVAASVLGAS